MSIMNAEIRPDGQLHLFGAQTGIDRIKDNGVKVMIGESVDFILMTEVAGTFCTYGPKGGSKAPYELIEWAFRNTGAFGVSIENVGGKNYPSIWFTSDKVAKRAFAALGMVMPGGEA